MSQDALNPQQFMYHISPAENRPSIEQSGLVGTKNHLFPGDTGRKRVYLTTKPEHYAGFAGEEDPMDVYKVNVRGLKARPDPHFGDAHQGAHYVEGNVHAKRVSHFADAYDYALGSDDEPTSLGY